MEQGTGGKKRQHSCNDSFAKRVGWEEGGIKRTKIKREEFRAGSSKKALPCEKTSPLNGERMRSDSRAQRREHSMFFNVD